jgi:cytochrome c-type biogenesis protein CcmH/NrfG
MKIIPIIALCGILTGLLYSQKDSLSLGNRYYSSLQRWYALAFVGDWQSADALGATLDPLDTISYRRIHHPDELKKVINSLIVAPDKSVEDWMELARIQAILGKKDDSLASLSKAYELDPIRDDLTTLYYKTKK